MKTMTAGCGWIEMQTWHEGNTESRERLTHPVLMPSCNLSAEHGLQVDRAKRLGMMLDSTPSGSEHMNSVAVAKMGRGIGVRGGDVTPNLLNLSFCLTPCPDSKRVSRLS